MEVKQLTIQNQILIKNVTQRTIAHIGQKGTGKTTLIRMAIDDLPPGTPCVVFDPLNVIEGPIKYNITHKSLGYGNIFAKLVNRHIKKNETIIIAFDRLVNQEITPFVDDFLPHVRLKDGLWIFDEIHEYTPQMGGAYSFETERLIRHTRNDNNGVWMSTQRPAFASKKVLALSDYIILFRLSYPNDLDVVKSLISVSTEKDRILKSIQGKGFLEGFTIDFDPKAGDYI